MITKTVRSRFDHEIGGTVEGGIILEKRVVIAPDPVERRRGVFEYVVEVPPTEAKPSKTSSKAHVPERGSYTRTTPDAMGGVILRLPSR